MALEKAEIEFLIQQKQAIEGLTKLANKFKQTTGEAAKGADNINRKSKGASKSIGGMGDALGGVVNKARNLVTTFASAAGVAELIRTELERINQLNLAAAEGMKQTAGGLVMLKTRMGDSKLSAGDVRNKLLTPSSKLTLPQRIELFDVINSRAAGTSDDKLKLTTDLMALRPDLGGRPEDLKALGGAAGAAAQLFGVDAIDATKKIEMSAVNSTIEGVGPYATSFGGFQVTAAQLGYSLDQALANFTAATRTYGDSTGRSTATQLAALEVSMQKMATAVTGKQLSGPEIRRLVNEPRNAEEAEIGAKIQAGVLGTDLLQMVNPEAAKKAKAWGADDKGILTGEQRLRVPTAQMLMRDTGNLADAHALSQRKAAQQAVSTAVRDFDATRKQLQQSTEWRNMMLEAGNVTASERNLSDSRRAASGLLTERVKAVQDATSTPAWLVKAQEQFDGIYHSGWLGTLMGGMTGGGLVSGLVRPRRESNEREKAWSDLQQVRQMRASFERREMGEQLGVWVPPTMGAATKFAMEQQYGSLENMPSMTADDIRNYRTALDAENRLAALLEQLVRFEQEKRNERKQPSTPKLLVEKAVGVDADPKILPN